MNRNRGTMSFHRLFSAQEIGFGANAGHFTTAVIRQFLRIGEAVAARWIEMPQGVLILQMVPGVADSGAIYLYDRKQQVFYMIGFDEPDDNLTLEEFNQLLVEYNLLSLAEHPDLALKQQPQPRQKMTAAAPALPLPLAPPPPPVFKTPLPEDPAPRLSMQEELALALLNSIQYGTSHGSHPAPWYVRPGAVHLHFQHIGSA